MNKEKGGEKKMKQQQIWTMVIVAVVVGAAAFFGGVQYQKSKVSSIANGQYGGSSFRQGGGRQAMMQGGQAGQSGQTQGMRPVSGQIASMDDKSITVKLPDGSSKIIVLSDTTKFNKSSEGTKADLKTGEQVMAFGTEGADGSVTAQNISIGGGGMFRVQSGQPKQQ
jgi:flagellar basal body-associated protein FliL